MKLARCFMARLLAISTVPLEGLPQCLTACAGRLPFYSCFISGQFIPFFACKLRRRVVGPLLHNSGVDFISAVMRFSIITPSFRNSRWLKLCIASASNQSYRCRPDPVPLAAPVCHLKIETKLALLLTL